MDTFSGSRIKITDIVPDEYEDFLSYCSVSEKVYSDEITSVDYIAYRTQYGRSKRKVKMLREIIEKNTPQHNKTEKIATAVTPQEKVVEQITIGRKNSQLVETNYTENTQTATEPTQKISKVFMANIDNEPTFAEKYKLIADSFDKVYIEDYQNSVFSVRSYNALRRASCVTLKDILLLTPSKLKGIRNLGNNSVKEIEEGIVNIVNSLQSCTDASNQITIPSKVTKRNFEKVDVFEVVNSILNNQFYNIDRFNDKEKEYICRIQDAIDILGVEICSQFFGEENVPYSHIIISMFDDFYSKSAFPSKIIESAKKSQLIWNKSLQKKLLRPFMLLFLESNTHAKNSKIEVSGTFIEKFMKEDILVNQYSDIIEDLVNIDLNKVIEIMSFLDGFQKWMVNIDLFGLCHEIFDSKGEKEQRAFDVIYSRANGTTLDEVGRQFGLTRERVRQIEMKALAMFITYRFRHQKNNLLGIIYAYRNGDYILRKEEIVELIGSKYGNLLWYCAIKTGDRGQSYFWDSNISHYDSVNNVIAITLSPDENETSCLDAIKIVENFPSLIETDKLKEKIYEEAKKNNVPFELCEIAVLEHYKKAGMLSYKGRLTVIQICEYILKNRFQNGYKIADETDSNLFRQYTEALFGKDKITTFRAVDSKIMDIGVLIDRGKYVHRDYIHVDKIVVDRIFSYIEENTKSVITYTEIFADLESVFAGTVITNRYILQGVMRLYNSPYESHRDYISKQRGGNVADELTAFVKSKGIVHKSEIIDEFTGWKDYNLGFVLPRCPEVICIDNGYYIHSDMLNISENTKNDIYKYLRTTINDIPVSVRYLENVFMNQFPNFMIDNDIQTHGKLFGILQYLFSKDFYFSRPYIAKDNMDGVTNKSVIIKYIGEMDTIEISDLVDLCKQNGVNFVSSSYLLDMMKPDYVRINEALLMKYECIGITEEIIQDVADLIAEAITGHNGYIAAKLIEDYSWYPSLNVPWTPFLLESIADMIPTGVNTIHFVSSAVDIPHSIFVSDEFSEDDYNSLILKLLKKEHLNEPFTSKTAVFEWLKEEGLCNKSCPLFLESEHHVFFDEEGKLRIE